jgi:hypothetical protein
MAASTWSRPAASAVKSFLFKLLIISHMELVVLSAEICPFGCVINYVSSNQLLCREGIFSFSDGVIPDGYAGFCNATLTKLSLDDCGMQDIPSGAFDHLPNLVSLELQNNDFSKGLNRTVFARLTKLNTLNLSYCKLKTLPSGIFSQLVNLTTLNLNSNDLRNIGGGYWMSW